MVLKYFNFYLLMIVIMDFYVFGSMKNVVIHILFY